MIDFHAHILPGIDDGARDLDMSLAMLSMLEKQGVGIVAATPHFYAHRQPIETFLQERQHALDLLLSKRYEGMPVIAPASEVYLERGIRNIDLGPLCYGETNLLLLELPYTTYQSWFLEEAYNLCLSQSITPVFAHLDRYLTMYPKDAINEILEFDDAIIQINHGALFSGQRRKAVIKWIKEGRTVLFGSDCHNLKSRCSLESQAQSVIESKLGKGWLTGYEEYSLRILNNPA